MAPHDSIQRSVLPIPDRRPVTLTTYDAKDPDTRFPPITPLRPPSGAPNVLIVLLDDVGFGASSAFGGPCRTPTAERLAQNGLKYNRFHTTALCSPTRAAMLSGRNHHAVGMGAITEVATSAPGYNSLRPNTCAPIAEILRLNGYSTAQLGKCHEVPVFEATPIGPFDHWPTGSGFEHFYGFIGGENNQYYPALYDGTTPIEPKRTPEEGYHLTEDLADKTIAWINQQKAMAPDKPFFIYLALGATHAPHHVPQEWIAKYKGRFDQGWDALREETFDRQKKLGVIPPDCELTQRPSEIPAWKDMDETLRPVLAREMEIYAAFLEHADHHVGRVIDSLSELGILDETLIFFLIGDNGASAEGSLIGTINEIALGDAPDLITPELMIERIDDLGTDRSFNHYAVGWAHAMDTPYQWTKQVASHWGGTRNGAIVHWPNGIKARGGIRSQFHHVIDVAPTILEAAGLPEPTLVNGVMQEPMHGVSMLYSFDEAQAAERHETQYFEMLCNRGIYHRGWTAVTRHGKPPWVMAEAQPPLEADVWELYDTNEDWSQARDLAWDMPEKLVELKRPVRSGSLEVQRVSPGRPKGGAGQLRPGRPPVGGTRHYPAAVSRHAPATGKLGDQHQEQVAFGNRRSRCRTKWGQRRDRRPGREHGRLEPLRARGETQVLLQRGGHSEVLRGLHVDAPLRQSPGPDGVRVRRRRDREGWERHSLPRWEADWTGKGRANPPVPLLDGRDIGGRLRCGRAGRRGLRAEEQRLQWQGGMGADRYRRCGHGHRPSDRGRGAIPARGHAAVGG
jgi:arylsulfatase A-like enzyme